MNAGGKKTKIAIVHPHFWWGGGEAVALWTAQALSQSYDVTLLTFDDVKLEQLDNFYGTSLHKIDVSIRVLPLPPFLKKIKSRFTLLRQHYMMRWCKRLKEQFSLFFSTYNEMDFGIRGVQYVHFPLLAGAEVARLGDVEFLDAWYHRASPVRWLYEGFGRLLSGYDAERMKTNVTLVNSNWTGTIVQSVYSISTVTVYPPVACFSGDNGFGDLSFEKREDGFVTIGRFEPSKKITEIIQILRIVREAGFNVHLHIVGQRYDEFYYKRLLDLQRENASWIFLEESLGRTDLLRLISSHKFGIHGKINEHFGIAVAEMVRMGCVVFVPNSGGQVEIIGSNPALVYSTVEDASKKIIDVLQNRELQYSLHSDAKKRGELFSAQGFMQQVKRIVGTLLEQ